MKRLIVNNGEPVPNIIAEPEAYFAQQFEDPERGRILGLKLRSNRIVTIQRVHDEDEYSVRNTALNDFNRNQYFLVSFENIVEQYQKNKIIKTAESVRVILIFGCLFQLSHIYSIIDHDIEGSVGMNIILLLVMVGCAYALFRKS